jgi:hypothetical protein
MSFVAQVLSRDVPTFPTQRLLISLHYCRECVLGGKMSFGWVRDPTGGYAVSVLDVDAGVPDGLGIVAQPMFPPSSARLHDHLEVPLPEEAGIPPGQAPPDYPSMENDFDERLYRDLIHIPRSKVGGWPTWVQTPSWPAPRNDWHFIAQLDSRISPDVPWAAGGYAYLFCRQQGKTDWRGEFLIQVT